MGGKIRSQRTSGEKKGVNEKTGVGKVEWEILNQKSVRKLVNYYRQKDIRTAHLLGALVSGIVNEVSCID